MTADDYRLAQALYLAKRFPAKGIEPERVEKIETYFSEGYHYSSYTYAETEFELWLHWTDAEGRSRSWIIDMEEISSLDLTEMVVEGLALLAEARQ